MAKRQLQIKQFVALTTNNKTPVAVGSVFADARLPSKTHTHLFKLIKLSDCH